MPFGLKRTAGISGHYSSAWAIALQLGAEACGSWWKHAEDMEGSGRHVEDKEGIRRGAGGAGEVQEVWKAMGKCGRGGKAWEVMVCYTMQR